MKKRTPDKFWFPWWPDKWIFGSIRIEFSPAERGIWVDLLSLASKDDGHIRANEETPYPIQQLSGMLLIPEKQLKDAIEKFTELGKLVRTETGTLYIAKWDKYQFGERHKRRIEEGTQNQEEDDFFNRTSIRCPSDFSDMKNKNGFVRMSRIIVAIAINRSLKKEEEVHHIDKKGNNNKPENLMLFKTHSDHGRYEHGYDVSPLWDGSKLSIAEISATMAKIKATIIYNSKRNNNTLNNKKASILSWENEFEFLWKKYPTDGRKNKIYSKKRFIALCKKGELKNFKKGYEGYSIYLEYKEKKENFKQSVKYFSTLCTDYPEYIKYYGHKVEANL